MAVIGVGASQLIFQITGGCFYASTLTPMYIICLMPPVDHSHDDA
jgi:hypothetical protein